MLTLWERTALKSGADLTEQPDGKWRWTFGSLSIGGHSSSVNAARSFLRFHRTGNIEILPAETPIVERKGTRK